MINERITQNKKENKYNKIIMLSALFVFLTQIVSIANEYEYPYKDGISKETYKKRRAELIKKLNPRQMFIAFSADHFNKTKYMTFRQSANLSYLSGATGEKTIVLVLSEGIILDGEFYKEILFTEDQTDNDLLWHGRKMKPREAEEILGFEKAFDYQKFDSIFNIASANHSDLLVALYTKGKHFSPYKNSKYEVMETNIPIINMIKDKNPYLVIETDKDILKQMRAIKDDEEIKLIQKAIDISISGHLNSMIKSKPNMYEYEIESIMEGEFLRLGAENNGYNSIVGTGRNTCYLHYTASRSQTKSGDLVLMDCGAEYHGYTADITRTFPINGKFSKEQAIIYNIVLEAQKLGIAGCKAGKKFFIADSICKDYIGRELTKLGLIKNKGDFKKYYPHGTSHYLGLDVHDVGTYGKLEVGNIITVEPGIYIPEGSDCDKKWWNIGVRIEDDILITKNGAINLSKALPREIKDIEELLKNRK